MEADSPVLSVGGTGLEYIYEMELQVSKRLAEDAQDGLRYLLENGEPGG
jgi:hypothetical protein